jgi:hypothetical protein
VDLFLPDGQHFAESAILSGSQSEHDYAEVATVDTNFSVDAEDPKIMAMAWSPMACPPPTRWTAGGTKTVRGTTFYPISHVYGPSQTDQTITLRSDRTVTKGYEISGGVGWSIGVLEAQTGVKLNGSVTTSMSEEQSFTVKKGMSVYLAAQVIYRQTTLARNVFAGPNCQPSHQSMTVLTPINTAVLVARAPA